MVSASPRTASNQELSMIDVSVTVKPGYLAEAITWSQIQGYRVISSTDESAQLVLRMRPGSQSMIGSMPGHLYDHKVTR